MYSVDDFISALEPSERLMMNRLRSLIMDTDPRIQEKLSYGVPYFFHHRRICFLWPASHLPCPADKPRDTEEKIQFGFCYGNLMSNDHRLLISDNRKQVYIIKIRSTADIDERVFREILQEAVLLDDTFAKKSNRSSQKR